MLITLQSNKEPRTVLSCTHSHLTIVIFVKIGEYKHMRLSYPPYYCITANFYLMNLLGIIKALKII